MNQLILNLDDFIIIKSRKGLQPITNYAELEITLPINLSTQVLHKAREIYHSKDGKITYIEY